MVLLSPPLQARTTNFFGPPGVRLGLLHGSSLGFKVIYLILVPNVWNRVLERLKCLLVAFKESRQPLDLLGKASPLYFEYFIGAVGIHIINQLP